jgi:hypothetical protein
MSNLENNNKLFWSEKLKSTYAQKFNKHKEAIDAELKLFESNDIRELEYDLQPIKNKYYDLQNKARAFYNGNTSHTKVLNELIPTTVIYAFQLCDNESLIEKFFINNFEEYKENCLKNIAIIKQENIEYKRVCTENNQNYILNKNEELEDFAKNLTKNQFVEYVASYLADYNAFTYCYDKVEKLLGKTLPPPPEQKKDYKKLLWFKVGLLFATGKMDKYYNISNMTMKPEYSAPKIAKDFKEPKYNKYILGTFKCYKNDKNIYSSTTKMKTIIEYCKTENIPINPYFIERYNLIKDK